MAETAFSRKPMLITLICLESSRRPNVHRGLGNGRQGLVGLLLLLQGLIQQPDRLFHTEPGSPSLQSSVAGDFVMLDRLRRGEQTGVERLAPPVFGHDLLALIENAFNRVAGLSSRRHVEQPENLLQTINLTFSLIMMLFKSGAQLVGVGGLRHLRQRLQNLLFSEVDVLERIEEEIVEVLVLRGHWRTPLSRRGVFSRTSTQCDDQGSVQWWGKLDSMSRLPMRGHAAMASGNTIFVAKTPIGISPKRN